MQIEDVSRKTTETVSMGIDDGPILTPFSWDRNPNVRRQIVGAVATRQDHHNGDLRKWRVDLRYRKLKKDGGFAAIGAGSLGAWNHEELERPEVAECLLLVCDRVGILAEELHDFADIVQDMRDENWEAK